MTVPGWVPPPPGSKGGVCRHNPGSDPAGDCGQTGTWHVRYARGPHQDTPLVVMTCDDHLGRCLRPMLVDGAVLVDPDLIQPIKMHEVVPGSACTLDPLQPTWWVDEMNACVTEEEGVRLGVLAYESPISWPCGSCGEETRVSHWRTNSDGTLRHDPFGVNHELMPEAKAKVESEWDELFGIKPVIPMEPCPKWGLQEAHPSHFNDDGSYLCPGWEGPPVSELPVGLCGNREDHAPHRSETSPSGKPMWCSADQSTRLPYAAERRREEERRRKQVTE